MSDKDPKRLAALQRERVGVERAGKTERLAAVDAEIKRLGGKPAKGEDLGDKPKGRRSKPKQETTAGGDSE